MQAPAAALDLELSWTKEEDESRNTIPGFRYFGHCLLAFDSTSHESMLRAINYAKELLQDKELCKVATSLMTHQVDEKGTINRFRIDLYLSDLANDNDLDSLCGRFQQMSAK